MESDAGGRLEAKAGAADGAQAPPASVARGHGGALRRAWRDVAPVLKAALMHGARVGARGAILGYFLRGGVDFLLRLLRILRGKASLIQAIRTTFGSSDALRTAWFFGTFSFLWKSVYDLSTALWKLPPERAGFAAGTIAGLALVFESKERRVGIAQQVLVRGLQAAYNTLKAANRFSFPNGDAFLFIVCSAQIMYSYVRHPEALPPTFYSFIRDTGPIPEPILKTVRAQLDGDPVPADLAALVKPYHPSALALETISRLGQPLQVVDCCLLHSHTDSCAVHGVNVFTKVFKLILPVYGILTTVPTVVFRFGTVLKRPAHMLRRIAQSTIRSSVFLGAFVSGYQEFVCMVRYLIRNKIFIERDAKALYWIAGAFASLSIFLEEKSRRTELALYTLPRAVESWYLISYGKGWVPYLPFFEIGMFSAGMGILLSAYHSDPKLISPFVARLMRAAEDFVEHPLLETSGAAPDSPKTATFIPATDPEQYRRVAGEAADVLARYLSSVSSGSAQSPLPESVRRAIAQLDEIAAAGRRLVV